MTPPTFITTSWDDGHPMDLRVADLLAQYGIAGTFYVPTESEFGTMSVAELRQLVPHFEIGAHTLRHVDLTRVANETAWSEIVGSKDWVENAAGTSCVSFCPPLGHFEARHLRMIREAGYLGLRSTEFLSLDYPRWRNGLMLMPTTVQAFPHRFPAFARNALKRMALANLWRYVVHGRAADWPTMAKSLFCHAVAHGGIFHLWGHSWELQDSGQWQRLKDVLRFLSDFASQAPSRTNGQIFRLSTPPSPVSDQVAKPAATRR